MKTFARLIRRYVLSAVGVVLLAVFLGLGILVHLSLQPGSQLPQRTYSAEKIADSMAESADGLAFGPEHTPEEWMDGYEWAMVLDDAGAVRWSYRLPEELNRPYTAGEIAGFARWYLADYPVFCWSEGYGLFVVGLAKGSLWKYSLYGSPEFLRNLWRGIPVTALLFLLAGLGACLLLSWRGAKRLKSVEEGLDALASGQTVRLPTDGFTGELARKLNRTGEHLRQQDRIIARRDNARTQWIAGVSHDVRTPMALILGWAEQLEGDTALPEAARQRAAGIRRQSERLRSLIDDLNLTSKLEYGAQPLRRESFRAGPLLRELAAQFCDGPLAGSSALTLEQSEEAEQARLFADRALLERLLENLLGNSVRHNEKPVSILLRADTARDRLCLTVTDDGVGYPTEILAALNGPEPGENAPHILGLHVVEQIATAHGGTVAFGRNTPQGAKTTVWLPLAATP